MIDFVFSFFKESRKNREVERLTESIEWLSDIKDSEIPKATSSLPELSKVNTLLDIALETTDTILEKEENFDVVI